MSLPSRSTGSSEKSSTDSATQVGHFYWLAHGLPRWSSTPRSKSPSGTDKTKKVLGPISLNLPCSNLLNLLTTGMFSHPGPTDPQCRLEQGSWWRQTKTDS